MTFGKKLDPNVYPKRKWSIVAPSGAGKSLFSARMKGDLAVIDADGQYDQVVFDTGITNAFAISEVLDEMRDTDEIKRVLDSNRKNAKDVGTIIVDSVTPIIKRVVTKIQHGKPFAKATDYRAKAEAMRILADVVTSYGKDVLFVYHKYTNYDEKGEKQVVTSVSPLEIQRLQLNLNAKLEIVFEDGKRGIKILWSRSGRSGDTLWDETGSWVDMPERIEKYMYNDLKPEEKQKVEEGSFSSGDDAIAWGFEQGVFKDMQHAKNAYAKLRTELADELGNELTKEVMFAAWRSDVLERITETDKEE